MVLLHLCWQPPFETKPPTICSHSFTSKGKLETCFTSSSSFRAGHGDIFLNISFYFPENITCSLAIEYVLKVNNKNPECPTEWKVSKYRIFSDLYFAILGLNTELNSVNSRTRKSSVFSVSHIHHINLVFICYLEHVKFYWERKVEQSSNHWASHS